MLRKLFTGGLVALLFALSATAKPLPADPDFAFPKKVEQSSSRELKNALKSTDYPAALRALMNNILAKNSIDSDNLQSGVDEISRIAESSSDEVFKSMLYLLEARILTDFYTADRYTFDNRQLPLLPYPDSVKEFSGDQFKARIASLLDSVASAYPVLAEIPTSKWRSCFLISDDEAMFYPTLIQTAGANVLSICQRLETDSPILPLEALNRNFGSYMGSNLSSPFSRVAFATFKALGAAAEGNSLLTVTNEINRIKWAAKEFDGSEIFKSYHALYSEIASESVSALILRQLYLHCSGFEQEKMVWGLCRDYLSRFREGVYNSAVTQLMKEIMTADATLSYPSATSPRTPVELSLEVRNYKSVDIEVFRIAKNKPSITAADLTTPIRTFHLEFDNSEPFKTDTVIPLTLDTYGLYTVTVNRKKSNAPRYADYPLMVVSDLYLESISPLTGYSFASVRSIENGAPLGGVNVVSYKNNTSVFSSVSTSDGSARISRYGNRIYASRGNDKFNYPLYYYTPSAQRERFTASVITSLPIYHPGDSMEFAGVAYRISDSERSLLKNKSLSFTLRDANWQVVATDSVLTDSLGRFSGRALLPSDGLTGNFALNINSERGQMAYVSFMVAQYKLPTFFATLSASLTPDSMAVISGKATTYSGFPIGEAEVTIDFSNCRRFYTPVKGRVLMSEKLVTESDGSFTLSVPAADLRLFSNADSGILASASVTASNGETQSASALVPLGYPYTLSVNMSHYDVISGAPLYSCSDSEGNKSSIPVKVEILNADSVVVCTLPGGNIASLSCGLYTVSVVPENPAMAAPASETNVLFYNSGSHDFFDRYFFWCEPKSIIMLPDRKGEVLIGSSRDSVIVEEIMYNDKAFVSRRMFPTRKGLWKYPVIIPDSLSKVYVEYSAIENGRRSWSRIKLLTPDANRSLNLRFESFRDRSQAGDTEKWTIRTAYSTGEPVQAAVMMDIISSAVASIRTPSPLNITPSQNYSRVNISAGEIYHRHTSSSERAPESVDFPSPGDPGFQTYGISFTGVPRGLLIRGSRMMMKSAATAANGAVLYESMAVSSDAVMDEMAVMEESADAGAAEAEEPEESGFSENSQRVYKVANQPLALFNPYLATNHDGQLEFSFTLPNVTTEWTILASAFTPDILGANLTEHITASKPLMVETAAPRYLRVADRIDLRATLMNLTEDTLRSVRVISEALSPDGCVVASDSLFADIDPMGSVPLSLDLRVPENLSGVLFRVWAENGDYADGEQVSIPVEPDIQQVVETHPYYFHPDSLTRTLRVFTPAGMNSILTFNRNAEWDLIEQIPGLTPREPSVSTALAQAIFCNQVSASLVRRYPAVATYLASASADSLLQANLNAYPELKLTLLEATPWVRDAMSEQQRLERLRLLFSQKAVRDDFRRNLNSLAKLVRNGGWGWSPDAKEPSRWATENILLTFARLQQLSYAPDDARYNSMLTDALKWLDGRVAEDVKKAGKPSVDMTYTLIRTFYPSQNLPTSCRRTVTATVEHLVQHGLSFPPETKALAAIILNANGYKATARKLMESVAEFSTENTSTGTVQFKNIKASAFDTTSDVTATAQILDGFSAVEPSSKLIPGLRLWLIFEATRRSFSDSPSRAASIIASVLGSTPERYSVPMAPDAAIEINSPCGSEHVEFSRENLITGSLSTPLPAGDATVTISLPASSSAFGSVYTVGKRPVSMLRPVSLPDLTISRRMMMAQNGTGGERVWIDLPDGMEVKPGTLVKTVITVTSGVSLSYVEISIPRPPCLEPVNQLPGTIYREHLPLYREPLDTRTRFFADFLPASTYVFEEECRVSQSGMFAVPQATLQSSFNPAYSVATGGSIFHSAR